MQTRSSGCTAISRAATVSFCLCIPTTIVALAWLLQHPDVTAPIIGATRDLHLADALAALEVTLSEQEVERLEAPYIPHPVVGFQ